MSRPSRQQRYAIGELGKAADAGAVALYDDVAYYEKTYRSRRNDVEYYLSLGCQSKGPVLEYGIGSGRIALPLARSGIAVTGIDISRPMLAHLKAQLEREPKAARQRVRAVYGDMRSVKLRRRFPLVIAPFNVFLHLYERRDVEQFLARVREHLTPRGRFVFDYSLPSLEDLCVDPEKSYGAPRFRHPVTGEMTAYSERFDYDRLRQILLCSMEFSPREGKEAGWNVPLTHRQFFPQEIEALLHYNGFTNQSWTADFSDEPPGQGTDSLVISCRPGRKRARLPATKGRR